MNTKILSKNNDGKAITVVKEVVEQFTASDLMQKKQQLMYQQAQIRQQMQQMKAQHENIALQIAELEEDLKSFESEELPTI